MKNPPILRRFFALVILSVIGLWAHAAIAQSPTGVFTPQLITFRGTPTGVCDTYQQAEDITTGNYYTCSSRAWVMISSSITSNSSYVFNVQNPAYAGGAKGDAQKISNGVTNAGTLITSTSNPWTAADVGKKIFCAGANNATLFMPVATITTFNSAGSINTGTTSNAAGSGLQCVWYTKDDASAFTSAQTAANTLTTTNDPLDGPTLSPMPGTVYCPPGGYAVGSRIFSQQGSGTSLSPSFVGAGRDSCIIYPIPTVLTDPGDGASVLFSIYNSRDATVRGFTVDGLMFLWSFTHPLVQLTSAQRFYVEDVNITNYGSQSTSQGAFSLLNSANATIKNVFVQNSPSSSTDYACDFQGTGGITVINISCSNHFRNANFVSSGARSVFSKEDIFIGGFIDECNANTGGCTNVATSSTASFVGTEFFVGNSGSSAIAVDGTSIVYLSNVSCGQYGSSASNTNCLNLTASGATAYADMSTLYGNGTGVAVLGVAGSVFNDISGNSYLHCLNAVCTAATIAQAYSGVVPTFPLGSDATTQLGSTQIVNGTLPTCTFTSGGGTSPSCTLDTGSTNAAGIIIMTTGTGAPASSGTITLTFSRTMGTNKPSCILTASQNGAGSWNARASFLDNTPSTASDLVNWDNNGVALSTSTAYRVNYGCYGK